MILAHLCDEPKGLKTNMCLVKSDLTFSFSILLIFGNVTLWIFFLLKMQSLVYLPFALANALTARLNAGYVLCPSLHFPAQSWLVFVLNKTEVLHLFRAPLVDEVWVLLGYCIFTASLYLHFATSVIHEITAALGIYCFRWPFSSINCKENSMFLFWNINLLTVFSSCLLSTGSRAKKLEKKP